MQQQTIWESSSGVYRQTPNQEQVVHQRDYPTLKDKYKLLNVLGSGAFSVVWRADHIGTGQAVAIKIVDKEKHAVGFSFVNLLQ